MMAIGTGSPADGEIADDDLAEQDDRADREIEATGEHDDRLTGSDDSDDRDLDEDVADVGGRGEHVGGDREDDEQGDADEERGEALEVAANPKRPCPDDAVCKPQASRRSHAVSINAPGSRPGGCGR